MRAYRLERFGSLDHLVLKEEPTPQPGPGQVLVQVKASGLNFRDLALLRSQYPMSCRPGLIPLSDGAGVVVAVGEGASRFQVGDRVAGAFFPDWIGGPFPLVAIGRQYGSDLDGWLSEYKVVDPQSLVAIPDHLSFEQAATLPCAAVTAWTALTGLNPIGPGDTVLTLGSGGVSLFALQLAKARGARVIATTSSAEKGARLTALGADAVIDYRQIPAWAQRVRELTGGLGVERVVEVGGPGTIAQSLQAVAVGGEISLIGFVAPGEGTLDFSALLMSGATLRRIGVGSRIDFEAMNRVMTQHLLEPVVAEVFAFEQAREAWRYYEEERPLGKVVIAHS